MTGVKCIREQPAIGGPPRFVNRSLLKSKFRYIRGSGGWCACTHMSHVSTTSCSWCSSQSVVYALAHVTWTRNSVGSCAGTHRRAGGPRREESARGRHLRRRPFSTRWRARDRDRIGPQCVTERSTHVLGDAPEQPAPALLCALSRHLGWFDRVGGLVRMQAVSLHPRAAVVPWLRVPAITARSRVRAWRRLGGCRRR